MSPDQALRIAQESALDLVEVSPDAVPPVCRVLDYGKYRYQLNKKAQEAKKKQKIIQDRKSTRLNSSHSQISYAVFCLKKKKNTLKNLEAKSTHILTQRN